MKQRLHSFGDHGNLVGISSQPTEAISPIGIVLLNAGVVHKVGPFSLNRVMSDYYSARGYTTLRFDFAGLGDSHRVNTGRNFADSLLADLSASLDLLERKFSINKVVIIGLCTGAENAYNIALQDSRVAGFVWMDGYGYDNAKGRLVRFKKRFLSLRRLAMLLHKALQNTDGPELQAEPAVDDYQWVLPAQQELANNLDKLHDRGVKFLNIYSGGVLSYNAYENQFRDTFKGKRFLASMDVVYFSQADHTYKIISDREKLLECILGWLTKHW